MASKDAWPCSSFPSRRASPIEFACDRCYYPCSLLRRTQKRLHAISALHRLMQPVRGSFLEARLLSGPRHPLFANEEPFRSLHWRPDEDVLRFWFIPHVVEEIAEILSFCEGATTIQARWLSLAVLSSIIVSVSKQDSETRYVRQLLRYSRSRPPRPCSQWRRARFLFDGDPITIVEQSAFCRRYDFAKGFASTPIARRPSNMASAKVVPLPQKGSRTTSPCVDNVSMRRRASWGTNFAA